VSRDHVGVPLVVAGAAGAFALVTLLGRRSASAAPTSPVPVAPVTFDFGRPVGTDVRAVVSSGWARPRRDHVHRALDIPLSIGTPILAIDSGTVVRVESQDRGDAGRWVGVTHPSGVTSRYLHLSRTSVTKGQAVVRGETLGLSGKTGNSAGPHLHLDLRVAGSMLLEIERLIGVPRPGWGPALAPYGYSIPGEPFVPVDGYRPLVEREAAEAGIPLRQIDARRNAGLVYRPVGTRGEPYPEWLRKLKGSSGVYVIRERGRNGEPVTVYVGESHSGRIYETLSRHFQSWRRWKGFWRDQFGEGHDPGLTYARDRVDVAVRITAPSKAIDEEARLIARLRPRDNLLGQPEAELEPAPF
jgi:hypothetical protein